MLPKRWGHVLRQSMGVGDLHIMKGSLVVKECFLHRKTVPHFELEAEGVPAFLGEVSVLGGGEGVKSEKQAHYQVCPFSIALSPPADASVADTKF